MKLKTLAIAIAVAAMPLAAQAEVGVSGDVTVGYFQDETGTKFLGSKGTNFTLKGSEQVGSLTYQGQVDFDVEDLLNGGGITSDDLWVGVKGGFGEVRIGDTDNGCDATDTGWVVPDVWYSMDMGGCKGDDKNNITYRRSMGAANVAVGYNPENEENFSVGVNGKIGPVTASLGYEDGDLDANAATPDVDNITMGISGAFGPVKVGIRANKMDGGDTDMGVNAAYSAGANTIYGGYGDVGTDNTTYFGYQRSLGKKTTFVAEYLDDEAETDKQYGIGLIHAF